METTGDMSVIKQDSTAPDWSLFDDIRDSHLLTDSNKSDNPLKQ